MAESEWIGFASDGIRRLYGYLASPETVSGPGILILHDMFGANAVFQGLAERYARRGRCALVPNLFWRAPDPGVLPYDGGHERAWERLQGFDFDRAVVDISLAIAHLRRARGCNGKVMVLGFCFSGRLAFRAAARTDVDAAVSLYALGISRDVADAPRIACPTQLHYGLADEHVPRSEIDDVAAGVAGNGNIALHLYEGAGHSFFNPVRPTYDAAASALAAARIDALIARLD